MTGARTWTGTSPTTRSWIEEYFVYDCGLGLLWGYRLPTSRARRYEPILPSSESGRLPSAVLGIELGIVSGQLSFFYGTAELLDRARLVRQLSGLVAEAQEKRQREWRQAEEERARAEERLWQSRREAVLSVMRARGLPLDEEVRGRIESCRDEAMLQRWLVRAATAVSADEVIG